MKVENQTNFKIQGKKNQSSDAKIWLRRLALQNKHNFLNIFNK